MTIDERLKTWFYIRRMAKKITPILGGDISSYLSYTNYELLILKNYMRQSKKLIDEFEQE